MTALFGIDSNSRVIPPAKSGISSQQCGKLDQRDGELEGALMLFNLTCPSCGRSQEASERVLGKGVRCSCGARFRVPGPKPSTRVDAAPSPARSRTAALGHVVERSPE